MKFIRKYRLEIVMITPLFLYKCLVTEIAPIRSKRWQKPPIVFTQAEFQRLLAAMPGKRA